MYSPQVLDHFENPRNAGELEGADAIAQLENPACGDVLRLSVKIENAAIVAARFKAKGCVPSIACGSILTEYIQGKTTHEARALKRETLVDALGGLPEASQHASHLAMDVLQAVLKKIGS